MAFYHGIRTSKGKTSISTPVVGDTGIPFAVGTAPGHMVNGKVNKPILAYSYDDAVAQLGYSDDWDKYTLCEVIYSHFALYNQAPVIFVNVLSAEEHTEAASTKQCTITDKKIELPLETVNDITVSSSQTGGTEYSAETDYKTYYTDDKFVIEIVEGSTITSNSVYVKYKTINAELVTAADIIGGVDVATGVSRGFQLIEDVYSKFNVIPDLLLAPGYSQNSEVAAIMKAHTDIMGLFRAKALIDVDTTAVTKYTDVNEWKNSNNIVDESYILCWPMVTLGGKKYHMSTQLAGVMSRTDYSNDSCPSVTPSNKTMEVDGLCLANGDEIDVNFVKANYLNSIGVSTCLNFVGGYKSWGNETAAYPVSTDVTEYFINVSRMFDWVAKTFILTFWSSIDGNITRRFIDAIVDSFNIYLNGLSPIKILGGRIEWTSEDNTITDLMAGKIKFKVYLTPPSPAREIAAEFEYDTEYILTALSAV